MSATIVQLRRRPELAFSVFELLDEAVDSGFLIYEGAADRRWLRESASPGALAEFLAQYGGGIFDGTPDLLHGVRQADLVQHCAAWLAAWRVSDDKDDV
jgi:hypothetical protein